MKRTILGAMVLAVAMAGTACDQEEAAKIDPRLDGISGRVAAVDPMIFENHAELYRKAQPAPPPPPTPAPVEGAEGGEAAPAAAEGTATTETPATSGDDAPPPTE
ncbi:MAG: hypothetical protein FWD53_08135 [Phycisphaerales bacterium]|nr:hypothetical protein [Phycisphaerales bacterium]